MNLLSVTDVGKAFRSYHSEWLRFARWIGLQMKPRDEIWVLRHITFEVKKGEVVGIVGQNGAGKSTLLKLIAGTLRPTEGKVHIGGRVAAILELGMGFNPELTGRQNVYHSAGLMGFSAEDIEKFLPEIEAFAEVGQYFNEPMRTYSSGMEMRVAFAVATVKQPELLIIDEALAVGDTYFQQKCMRKILELKEAGVSILFVSHDINSIKVLCDKVVLIDQGIMIDVGEPKEIINFYQNMILEKSHQGDLEFKQEKIAIAVEKSDSKAGSIAATGDVELIELSLRDIDNKEINYIVSEHTLKISFSLKVLKALDDPHYGFMIRNKFGISAFETNTYSMKEKSSKVEKGQIVTVEFSFSCNLSPANYSISIGVANKGFDRGSFEEYLLFIQDIEMLKVIENSDAIIYDGVTNLKPVVSTTF